MMVNLYHVTVHYDTFQALLYVATYKQKKEFEKYIRNEYCGNYLPRRKIISIEVKKEKISDLKKVDKYFVYCVELKKDFWDIDELRKELLICELAGLEE